ncbi:MAG: VWA domain-containing protein [Victivallaceae bacterium]|nr:VWA domain-containing protein [Victivallaceae bacterium]
MTFAYPWLLFLYIPLTFIIWYMWSKKAMPALKVASTRPFIEAKKRGNQHSPRLPLLFYAIAAIILVFALARPRVGSEKIIFRAKGIDIILAIDLSGSMYALDIPRDVKTEQQLQNELEEGKIKNRLDVAKEEIRKFVEKRPNDRIGLIGFAQMPYNICPPTLDHGWLLDNLKRLKPGIIGRATGIAGPIAGGVRRLDKSDSKRRVLVLFTDGTNTVEERITPRQAAKLGKTCDVVIYTVGIGSNNALIENNSVFGRGYVPAGDTFDEPLLQDIAKISDGKYYHAYDAQGLAEAMADINKIEKTTVEQPKYIDYKEFAPTLAVFVLILLLLGFLLENSVFLSIP